jgi:2-phosphosulfolactate phosphatase
LEIHRATLDTCAQATGTVVVIDVLRAFTTAAFAFAAGAADITLVGAIEEAFALRERNPDLLLAGEVYGLPIESFDYGNSPSAFLDADLSGRRLVQRTSAGTQGVVRSQNADTLLASSLCCARATVDTIRRHPGQPITLVITGARPDDPADEDAACADYLEALLTGQKPIPGPGGPKIPLRRPGLCGEHRPFRLCAAGEAAGGSVGDGARPALTCTCSAGASVPCGKHG